MKSATCDHWLIHSTHPGYVAECQICWRLFKRWPRTPATPAPPAALESDQLGLDQVD